MNHATIQAEFERHRNAVEQHHAIIDRANDEKRDLSGEETEQIERLDATITEALQRAEAGLAELEREARADEARARFEQLNPPVVGTTDAPNSDQEKVRRLISGESRAEEFEARDLTAGTATDGAELVPTTLHDQLHEHMIEVSSVMQAGATVINKASGEQLDIPKTTSYSSASIVAEAAAIGESDPQFATVSLTPYKYGFMVQVSSELLADSQFDVVSFLARQGGRALGDGIGAHLVSGTGTGQPNGVDNATSGKTTASGTAITTDELIDLQHSVLAPYRANATWIMNDSTAAAVRKLKDGNNQYLWQPGLVAGAQSTLLGNPVRTDPNMAAIAVNNITVVYGDLSGYYAVFAGPVRIERSDDFAFANDLVTFRFLWRADGDIVDTVGIRVLTQAAA